MTLIELLFNYQDIVSKRGRQAGNDFLNSCCDADLAKHIIASVHDKGFFIKADGDVFDVREWI